MPEPAIAPRSGFEPRREALLAGRRVVAGIGDLTRMAVDAIVCPANSHGLMRGGVAKAIRETGGDQVERAAVAMAPIPLGRAVATPAGDLPCEWVLHAPTMRKPVELTSRSRVRQATLAAMRRAESLRLRSVAFPGMGTGTGGLAYAAAATAMIEAILEASPLLQSLTLVALVSRSAELADAWVRAIDARPEFQPL